MSNRFDGPWQMHGGRARRGPKGYRRSDDRLKDDIVERMMAHDELDVSDVTLDVQDAKVVLDGTVPERWMRYLADDIAESVVGVESVENRVRVRRTPDASPARAEEMGGGRSFA